MNKLKLQVIIFLALILVLPPMLCGHAKAAPKKPIVLKFAHMWPATSPRQQMFDQWAQRIETGTNGKVKIIFYPSCTLVPPMEGWTSVTIGACDIGSCWANMHRAGFEFNTGQLFFWVGAPNVEFGMKLMDRLREKYPRLKEEYAEAKVLWLGAHGPRQLFTSRKAIRSLEDMKGMQIRAVTPAEAKVLKAVQAVAPSFVSMTQVYTSLQKGIIDGLWSPTDTLKSFRLAEVVKYVNKTNFEVGHNKYVAMNWNVWNSLPSDIQEVFEKASAWAKLEDIKIEDKSDADAIDYAKSLGVEIIELTPKQFTKLTAIVIHIQDKMAADLDAKGYRGTALLKDIRDAISKAK